MSTPRSLKDRLAETIQDLDEASSQRYSGWSRDLRADKDRSTALEEIEGLLNEVEFIEGILAQVGGQVTVTANHPEDTENAKRLEAYLKRLPLDNGKVLEWPFGILGQ